MVVSRISFYAKRSFAADTDGIGDASMTAAETAWSSSNPAGASQVTTRKARQTCLARLRLFQRLSRNWIA
jgi:hypothetical protein